MIHSPRGSLRPVSILVALLPGCKSAAIPPAPSPAEPAPVVLIVENTTHKTLGVYLIEQKTTVRIGGVEPASVGRLPIQNRLLQGRTLFRVYAFRAQEACPVARLININLSRTPRITVTETDTVVSAYPLLDSCRTNQRNSSQ